MAEKASSKQYLVVDEDGKGHLPVRDSPDGPLNHHLMGGAWAALHGGYRGNKYEGPGKEAAIEKLKGLYRSEGMELPDSESGEIGGEPRFIVLLADPPATGMIRIPIAITGSWKGGEKEFSIGLDDLEEIRANFAKKPTGEINVDYEHASEVPFGTGGPVISAGRIVKLEEPAKLDGTGKYILWGLYEPTDRARELIKGKEYRYVSPAIRWGAKDKVSGKTVGTMLTSLALVNKPFLEELPQIQASEVEGGGKVFVSLGQLHVPGPVNQISVAYRQPGNTEQGTGNREQGTENREQGTGNREKRTEKGGKTMAKSVKLKCLTDTHLEKHSLPASSKGKIGVFDGEDLLGVADDGPEGWEQSKPDDEKKTEACELFASEVGVKDGTLEQIAALVRRGKTAPVDRFALLSAAIHDGRLSTRGLVELADAGKVGLGTILEAQEAERKVQKAVNEGRILPANRGQALKLCLADPASFTAFVEKAKPVVDLKTHGHAQTGEGPVTAQQQLMAEVNAYAKEHNCSVSVALSEVTKANQKLWEDYSAEIVTAVEAAQEEE